MGRLAKLTARFLTDFGFSIGIEDVQPTTRLTAEKSSLLSRGYAQCDRKIAQFDAGKLQPSPGCTPEQTLESEINGLLSKIREDAGEICKHELHHLNAPLTMATYVARPAGPAPLPSRMSRLCWSLLTMSSRLHLEGAARKARSSTSRR